MTRAPTAPLWHHQEELVSRFLESEPGHIAIVEAAPGAGKTTASVELLGRALAGPRGAGLGLYVGPRQSLGRMNQRLRRHGLAVVRMTKRDLRERGLGAELNAIGGGATTVVLVALEDLAEPRVLRALAPLPISIIIVDEAASVDVAAINTLTELSSSARTLVLTDFPLKAAPAAWGHHRWPHEPPTRPADWFGPLRLDISIAPFLAHPAEVDLRSRVTQLVGLARRAPREFGVGDLEAAINSSPYALQGEALRAMEYLRPLRHTATHFRTGSDRSPITATADAATLLDIYRQLEEVIDAAERVEHDVRFDVLASVLATARAPRNDAPRLVFVQHERTAEYVAARAAALGIPISADLDISPHTALVVSDTALSSADIWSSAAIFYDLPGRTALSERLRHVRAEAQESAELVVLADLSRDSRDASALASLLGVATTSERLR